MLEQDVVEEFDDDDALLTRARKGDHKAYEQLFVRHYPGAVRLAAAQSSSVDPEDAASEAFTRIWSALSEGGGPTQAFGPYLIRSVRNIVTNRATRRREDASDDNRLEAETTQDSQQIGDGFSTALAEHSLMSKAFKSLPGRWRDILWMIDVEGHETAEVAEHLGLSRNSTAALTKRARDALSSAWLQEHVEEYGETPDCRWVTSHLAAYSRQRLTARQSAKVEQHLAGCLSCERASKGVTHLASSLRVWAALAVGSASAATWAMRAAPVAAAAEALIGVKGLSLAQTGVAVGIGATTKLLAGSLLGVTAIALLAVWMNPPQDSEATEQEPTATMLLVESASPSATPSPSPSESPTPASTSPGTPSATPTSTSRSASDPATNPAGQPTQQVPSAPQVTQPSRVQSPTAPAQPNVPSSSPTQPPAPANTSTPDAPSAKPSDPTPPKPTRPQPTSPTAAPTQSPKPTSPPSTPPPATEVPGPQPTLWYCFRDGQPVRCDVPQPTVSATDEP